MVVIGKILTSWGVRGEAKVLPLTFSNERFGQLQEVKIRVGEGYRVLTIEHYREAGRFVIIKFKEFATAEEVKQYSGKELLIPEELSPPLPEGVYYHYQILGLEVYTDEGEFLGKITNIIETGGNDVYVVSGHKEILVPAIEEVVKKIDLEAKRMIIHPMKGMLDL